MKFNPGIDVQPLTNPLGFRYGTDVFGPKVENRHLADIRKSLKDPLCNGPEVVYSIAMDVGKKEHIGILKEKNLLFGVVTYASGKLGDEPVRSQGHIHKKSPQNGWSTPEVYEIWSGKAIIYMQESAKDNPGRCFAVVASVGEIVIVPPGWAHATISADPSQPLTFGAWCDRNYGFEYDDVRAHNGLAWFPILDSENKIKWEANLNYQHSLLKVKSPENYQSLNIDDQTPIYQQFEEDFDRFSFVPDPKIAENVWPNFIP